MRPLTILLVEDEPVIALDLQAELEQEGHQVFIATDAVSAVRLCDLYLPDVAILNFLLDKGTDGVTLGRALRIRYHMRVLLVTGARGRDLEAVGSFDAGCEVLYKPFTRQQLRRFFRFAIKPSCLP